jgi:hypothetical protein
VLEGCRHTGSSPGLCVVIVVYGANTKLPFSVTTRAIIRSVLYARQKGQSIDGAFLQPSLPASVDGLAVSSPSTAVGTARHGGFSCSTKAILKARRSSF